MSRALDCWANHARWANHAHPAEAGVVVSFCDLETAIDLPPYPVIDTAAGLFVSYLESGTGGFYDAATWRPGLA